MYDKEEGWEKLYKNINANMEEKCIK